MNPFAESADPITQISVLAIIGIVSLSIGYLLFAFFRFKSFFNQDIHAISDSEKLQNLVFEFKLGLVDYNGQKKSFTSFHNKVSKTALLNLFFNDKVLNSVSNVLVGFGILGTFLGLSKGVSGFVMDSTDTIKESIGSLLSGMGTAFISSIWGMLSSLIFVLIYQFFRHSVAKRTDRFYAAMDREFLMTELEHADYERHELRDSLREVVKEYFVEVEDGLERTPRYYYRELLLNSRNQTSALSTFADDLAGLMEDMMDKLLEVNSEKFKEIIEEKLVPVLEQLREEKQESASDALEGILTKLEVAMKDMLNDFKDSISGETKGEMANLAASLGNVTEALGSMPSDIQGMFTELKSSVNGLAETVELMALRVTEEQEKGEKLRLESQKESSDRLKKILDDVGENVESLLSQQSTSTEKLNEVLLTVDDIISKNSQTVESFQRLLTNSKSIYEDIQSSSYALREASSGLKEGSQALENSSREVTSAVESFLNANNESIERIRAIQEEINAKTRAFLDEFSKMEEGVEAVFDQFNQGLEGYTTNLNEALSDSIGKYVEESKGAIEALGGLTRELTLNVEELTEVMSSKSE